MDFKTLNQHIELINGDLIKSYYDWREAWFRLSEMINNNQHWIDTCIYKSGYCSFTGHSLNSDLEIKRKQAIEEIGKLRKALKFPMNAMENPELFVEVDEKEEPNEIWMIKTNLVKWQMRTPWWGLDEEAFKNFVFGH